MLYRKIEQAVHERLANTSDKIKAEYAKKK